MGKKMTAKAAVRLINDILMVKDGRPEPSLVNNNFVTLGGRLRGGSLWRATTVISMDEDSLSFSVQLPGGAMGYATDIMTEFVDEETVTKYANHALNTIYKRNNWEKGPENGVFSVLDHATLKYSEQEFPTSEAAEEFMRERSMNGSIYNKKTGNYMVHHFAK